MTEHQLNGEDFLYYQSRGKFLPNHPRNDSIYTLNRDNYRTAEFDQIDWAQSIVLFGCSNVFGTALRDNETISYHLEQISGIPTVNLGYGAGSMIHILYNQMALSELGVTPRAIVNIWTNIHRVTLFTPNFPNTALITSSLAKLKMLFTLWNEQESNPAAYGIMVQRLTHLLWKGVPQYEATFFEGTDKALAVPFLPMSDFARDGAHPGPVTAKEVAALIYDNLKTHLQD